MHGQFEKTETSGSEIPDDLQLVLTVLAPTLAPAGSLLRSVAPGLAMACEYSCWAWDTCNGDVGVTRRVGVTRVGDKPHRGDASFIMGTVQNNSGTWCCSG